MGVFTYKVTFTFSGAVAFCSRRGNPTLTITKLLLCYEDVEVFLKKWQSLDAKDFNNVYGKIKIHKTAAKSA